MRYGMLWYDGITFIELSSHFADPIYPGNFVKNMLKVNTIIDEIIAACKLSNKPELEIQLHKIQTIIIHDIVTNNSIYLYL